MRKTFHNPKEGSVRPFTDLSFVADGLMPTPALAEGSGENLTGRVTRESRVMELYDQLRPSLLAYLAGVGMSLSEAEDVVQEAFIRLFDHIARKDGDENLCGWLFRVAHNLAMDSFRSARHTRHTDSQHIDLMEFMVDPSATPEEDAIKNEELRRVSSSLARLTQQQRAAVLLRAEALRYREVAAVLGISTKRAGELIQRALSRLAGDI